MTLWPCLEWNIFSNGMKVIIYAYAHIIIDYYDLKMIFEIFELINSLKFKKIGRFWRKQGPFTENTVASFTSSVAHDLNFGLDLLNRM